MVKDYFVKYSYDDAKQPLRRIHCNSRTDLNLRNAWWDVITQLRKDEHLKDECQYPNLTIDFMIEVESDD